jgi:hypothetical protein
MLLIAQEDSGCVNLPLSDFDVDPRISRTVRFEIKHRSGVPGAAAQLSSSQLNPARTWPRGGKPGGQQNAGGEDMRG